MMDKRKRPREHGETWERVRRLYIRYPLLPVADIATLCGVSRARANACVTGLLAERERLRAGALAKISHDEKL